MNFISKISQDSDVYKVAMTVCGNCLYACSRLEYTGSARWQLGSVSGSVLLEHSNLLTSLLCSVQQPDENRDSSWRLWSSSTGYLAYVHCWKEKNCTKSSSFNPVLPLLLKTVTKRPRFRDLCSLVVEITYTILFSYCQIITMWLVRYILLSPNCTTAKCFSPNFAGKQQKRKKT
jgi:hypothetical protein